MSTDESPRLGKRVLRGCWMGSRNQSAAGFCLGMLGVGWCLLGCAVLGSSGGSLKAV